MTDIGHFEADDIKSIPTARAAYSDRTALLMAKLAYRAYEKFDVDDAAMSVFSDSFRQVGLSECIGLVESGVGTAGFVVAGDDIIVIAFRGTEDIVDWLTNARLAWVTLQGGTRVHTGFFQAYWPIRERLFAEVERLLTLKARAVYVTGHSLGGALALMATAELANHQEARIRDSIAACYTFGCPRAGDASFDLYVKVPLYRVTNGVDMVPSVPPAILGYRHVGDTRYFGVSGMAPSRKPQAWYAKGWRTVLALLVFARTFRFLNVADHSMTVYIAKLSAWAQLTIKETNERRKKTADPEIKPS